MATETDSEYQRRILERFRSRALGDTLGAIVRGVEHDLREIGGQLRELKWKFAPGGRLLVHGMEKELEQLRQRLPVAIAIENWDGEDFEDHGDAERFLRETKEIEETFRVEIDRIGAVLDELEAMAKR